MLFVEILRRCKGQTVVLNNNDERVVVDVDEDFVVLQGGNPQLRITEFVPIAHVVRLIRSDYATGVSSTFLDLAYTGGDQRRIAADH